MRWIFTPVLSGKPWNGDTLVKEPLGGSESAVGFLARALARRQHEVLVFTHHTGEGLYEGVQYFHSSRLNTIGQLEADVHVSARWIEPLQATGLVKEHILWLHDMSPTYGLNIKNVFLSQAHLDSIEQKPDGKSFFIIGNGVNLADFADYVPLEQRDRTKLIWTSNPDRGLHVAARILQVLRKKHPELTLHVYGRASVYGWDASAEVPYYPAVEDRENIILHDPLPKAELAKELATAWAWFYPTTWPETYCIAALEAQAAGTPCLCPPYGALTETVKGGILTDKYEEPVERLMDDGEWNKLSFKGRAYAANCDWDNRAEEWERLVNG